MNIINVIGKYKQSGREWYQRAVDTIQWITVHHTADTFNGTDDQVLKKEMTTHVVNGWPGLSYHFFITKNGNIYQINNFTDVTWHDMVNWDSIGVALQGYFHTPSNEKPTYKQLQSLKWLLDQLCTQHSEFPADQKNVVGHRERSSTACPGDNLIGLVQDYRNKLGQVSWGNISPIPTPTPTPTPIDYQKLYTDLDIKFTAYKKDYIYKQSDLDAKVIQSKTDMINKIKSYLSTL